MSVLRRNIVTVSVCPCASVLARDAASVPIPRDLLARLAPQSTAPHP